MAAHTQDDGVRAHTVRLGVSIPGAAGRAGQSLERTLARCIDMGVTTVDIAVEALETVLGVPVPAAPLEPPPADGLAVGLLELEEDVLRDSYDLAKQTFDAQVRAWRATASLAPLSDLQRDWRNAGVSLDIVSVRDLILWSDEEVDYACRVAHTVGARVLATRASLAGPRRLTPFAHRHGIVLSLEGDATTGASELSRLLDEDDQVAVAVDLDTWATGGHGSPLPFLHEHAPRISHVRLPPGDRLNDARFHELLDAVRENDWAFSVIVSAEGLLNHAGT